MEIILCLDNRNGIQFNKRRQSRDREVIKRILCTHKDEPLICEEYSRILFGEVTGLITFLDKIDENVINDKAIYFFERTPEKAIVEKADTITLYKWNRDYPGDMFFNIDETEWHLYSEQDFKGFSHEKITEQIFKK